MGGNCCVDDFRLAAGFRFRLSHNSSTFFFFSSSSLLRSSSSSLAHAASSSSFNWAAFLLLRRFTSTSSSSVKDFVTIVLYLHTLREQRSYLLQGDNHHPQSPSSWRVCVLSVCSLLLLLQGKRGKRKGAKVFKCTEDPRMSVFRLLTKIKKNKYGGVRRRRTGFMAPVPS